MYMKKFKLDYRYRKLENPTIEQAEAILKEVRLFGAEELITEGGGSLIDIGKYVAKNLRIYHTAIPTTAGTGAEVTKYCVLTVDGKKKTFVDDAYIPNSYILDPKRIIGLPYAQTLSSGLDALCQGLESFWSVRATPKSKQYASLAIDLVLDNLQKSLDNPLDEKVRMNMLMAANFSGRAINIARTNVCHSISYPLTDIYKIPHGIACYMSLRYFAKKIGIGLNLDFEIPKYEFDKEVIADIAIENEKLKDYPGIITREDIINAL